MRPYIYSKKTDKKITKVSFFVNVIVSILALSFTKGNLIAMIIAFVVFDIMNVIINYYIVWKYPKTKIKHLKRQEKYDEIIKYLKQLEEGLYTLLHSDTIKEEFLKSDYVLLEEKTKAIQESIDKYKKIVEDNKLNKKLEEAKEKIDNNTMKDIDYINTIIESIELQKDSIKSKLSKDKVKKIEAVIKQAKKLVKVLYDNPYATSLAMKSFHIYMKEFWSIIDQYNHLDKDTKQEYEERIDELAAYMVVHFQNLIERISEQKESKISIDLNRLLNELGEDEKDA